jgi:hypothetical protein
MKNRTNINSRVQNLSLNKIFTNKDNNISLGKKIIYNKKQSKMNIKKKI